MSETVNKLSPQEAKDVAMIAKVIAGGLMPMDWTDFVKEHFLLRLRAEMEIGK